MRAACEAESLSYTPEVLGCTIEGKELPKGVDWPGCRLILSSTGCPNSFHHQSMSGTEMFGSVLKGICLYYCNKIHRRIYIMHSRYVYVRTNAYLTTIVVAP